MNGDYVKHKFAFGSFEVACYPDIRLNRLRDTKKSEYPVTQLRFEQGTPRIQVCIVTVRSYSVE